MKGTFFSAWDLQIVWCNLMRRQILAAELVWCMEEGVYGSRHCLVKSMCNKVLMCEFSFEEEMTWVLVLDVVLAQSVDTSLGRTRLGQTYSDTNMSLHMTKIKLNESQIEKQMMEKKQVKYRGKKLINLYGTSIFFNPFFNMFMKLSDGNIV